MQLTGEDCVAIRCCNEELLALEIDHKNLCNDNGFENITEFLETKLEDSRLRILKGSPDCKVVMACNRRLAE